MNATGCPEVLGSRPGQGRSMRILIVEDEASLCQFLKKKLVEAGFVADTAMDGREAEELGNATAYHAVILDLGLPSKSGMEVLKSWRSQRNQVPVIVLTGRNSWQERVQGIEAGADDYLGKPFHIEELVARLKALIQRSHARQQGMLKVGEWQLDEERQAVRRPDGQLVGLSATEFKLWRMFMFAPGKIFSKDSLMDAIYDYDTVNDHNIIEVYINRLRKKLGREVIRTLRWQGYVFEPGAEA